MMYRLVYRYGIIFHDLNFWKIYKNNQKLIRVMKNTSKHYCEKYFGDDYHIIDPCDKHVTVHYRFIWVMIKSFSYGQI